MQREIMKKEDENEEKLIRILSQDIRGNMKVYPGLARIKGISWSISNAICKSLKIDPSRKVGSLSKEEIDKIILFAKNPNLPKFLYNRRFDLETGKDMHLVGSDLEFKKEFDIKRLKKIKSYRGLRHSVGLPSRGQRTRSHFRKNRKRGVGIKLKKKETREK